MREMSYERDERWESNLGGSPLLILRTLRSHCYEGNIIIIIIGGDMPQCGGAVGDMFTVKNKWMVTLETIELMR